MKQEQAKVVMDAAYGFTEDGDSMIPTSPVAYHTLRGAVGDLPDSDFWGSPRIRDEWAKILRELAVALEQKETNDA